MPLHMAPAIRTLEEIREADGVQAVQDSVGVTILKTQESLGQRGKVVPKQMAVIIYRGVQHTTS